MFFKRLLEQSETLFLDTKQSFLLNGTPAMSSPRVVLHVFQQALPLVHDQEFLDLIHSKDHINNTNLGLRLFIIFRSWEKKEHH